MLNGVIPVWQQKVQLSKPGWADHHWCSYSIIFPALPWHPLTDHHYNTIIVSGFYRLCRTILPVSSIVTFELEVQFAWPHKHQRLISMHSILAKPDNVTSFSKIFLRANTPSSLFFCIPQEALNACENSTRISRCHGLFFFSTNHQLQGVSLSLICSFVFCSRKRVL